MKFLVDTCIWIDFFNNRRHFQPISNLMLDNQCFINPIILAELIPAARLKKETELIDCLGAIESLPLQTDWDEISEIQYQCVKSGINKLGLVDIAIAQNAKQHDCGIFSTDKHMDSLCDRLGLKLRKE